jgi:type II secretory pathway pseudopilin PulG
MKKVLMVVLLLLGLGAAGAGYYIFVMKPEQDAAAAVEAANALKTANKDSGAMTPPPTANASTRVNTYYFVNQRRLPVRNLPDESVYPDRYLYKSESINVIEIKEGWGRISAYYTLDKADKEYAEWVRMEGLVDWLPIITKEERDEMLTTYIGKSDNFHRYKESFFTITDRLIKEKICTPEDFEEVQGWMRSINYQERNVYFVYCGGLRVSDKIYFDVDSGEMFY